MPLILVPTPIGNLEDMTLRGLKEMREADCIACEDTRHTLKLLNHFGIKKTLISCHEHNEKERAVELMGRLKRGQRVVLVSDAGTPGISDPGYLLVSEAIRAGVPVDALPGANALLPALLLSGLPPSPFVFLGFLEGREIEKRKRIAPYKDCPSSLVFYISPHRLARDILFLHGELGSRNASLIREISKLHQEIKRGSLDELADYVQSVSPRGEYVAVVEGRVHVPIEDNSWMHEAAELWKKGCYDKDIVNQLAERYDVSKNKIKQFLLKENKEVIRGDGT